MVSLSFFFFQAEDGIRDLTVTGVQTCALPISSIGLWPAGQGAGDQRRLGGDRHQSSARRQGSHVRRQHPQGRTSSEGCARKEAVTLKRTLAVCALLVSAVVPAADGAAQPIRSGPSSCKAVALTFDMCPVREGAGYDAPLIDMLTERRIPATFFLSGRWITKHERSEERRVGKECRS